MMMRNVLAVDVAAPSQSPPRHDEHASQITHQVRKRPSDSVQVPASAPPANKKLRSMAVSKADEPVTVVPLDTRLFVSWAAFDAYFDAYCARTFQVFRSNTCVPVTARNGRILERLATKGPNHYESYKLIPERFETYTRTLVCTHAGEPRRRNEGKRPNRNFRALGCPAKVNVAVRRINGTVDGAWHVHVTDQVAVHNHAISEAQFKLYPQQRRVTDPDVLRTVRAMRKYGTPRRGIYEYIKDATGLEAITMRDVTNLLNKMKAEDEKEAAAGADVSPEESGSDRISETPEARP